MSADAMLEPIFQALVQMGLKPTAARFPVGLQYDLRQRQPAFARWRSTRRLEHAFP